MNLLRRTPLPFVIALGLTSAFAQQQPPTREAPAPDLRAAAIVIYNNRVEGSKALAEYYGQQRGIPGDRILGFAMPEAEEITRRDFEDQIQRPLQEALETRKWWAVEERNGEKLCVKTGVRLIVLVKGVPLKIAEDQEYEVDPKSGKKEVKAPAMGQSNAASVDSELSALGLIEHAIAGPLKNPYFSLNESFATQPLAPFFLVGRIDGPTMEQSRRLIDDAVAVEKSGLYGRVYLDLAQKNEAGYKEGEEWIMNSGRIWGQSGFPVIFDTRAERFPGNYPMSDAAIYLGWYVQAPDGPFLNPDFRLKRGAVACHIHSFSAVSLRDPAPNWTPRLIQHGAAAALGNVYEPFLSLTAHLDVFSDRLLRGFTLIEAAGMATPGVSWMPVVIGDPLYRPFIAPIALSGQDRDFRLLRSMMKEHAESGAQDKKILLTKLRSVASQNKSGMLYEALAQLAQGLVPGDAKGPLEDFSKAISYYTAVPDKIRATLQRADLLRQQKEEKEAMKVLQSGISQWGKAPEAKALEIMLAEWKQKSAASGTP